VLPLDAEKYWDAIIIGGGPAGSTVARYAAEGGLSVLVIDGRDPIGSPLQCGELVPTNEEMKRLCPGVPEMDDLFRTPANAISRKCEKMRIVKPNGKGMEYDFKGMVLDRVAHDEALVELAQSKGADYLLGKRVKRVDGDSVVLSNGSTMRGRVIVGAGGHNDPIRKRYWDEESLNIPVKFALKNGDHAEALELHFGSVAPGGYAWVFPKNSGSNIGLGIQRRMSRGKSLEEYANDFIERFEGREVFRGAGYLPMSGTVSTFVKGNYMIVGDSAGMVLPSNGAGITIAMIGGRIAGEVISEHVNNGMDLKEYEKRWESQMGDVMRNSKRSFAIGSILFRFPDWFLNFAFNPITKGIIWRAVTCRRMFWIF
jgi:digeranylgeranylglycerophospholipid reductase